MKRVVFISPVDHMSGNLSGKQELEYAENDNKAFEAPDGVQYARNYKPRFIGAHRAKDGRNYFQVRTKSAANLKTTTRLAMAALGAASSLAEVIMGKNSEWATIKANIQASFDAGSKSGAISGQKSAKTWLAVYLRDMYASKSDSVALPNYAQPGSLISDIYNQFTVSQWDEERDPGLSEAILTKFWEVLSRDGVKFKVNGMTGVAFANEDFITLIQGGGHNVLGLTTSAGYVKIGGTSYLIDAESRYVQDGDSIEGGEVFGTTTTAPQP